MTGEEEARIRADEAREHVLRADSLRAHLGEKAAEYEELWQQWDELRTAVESMLSPLDDDGHISRWVLRADVLALIDGAAQ